MKLGRFRQTPLENKIYVVDYSQWLGSGETLLTVNPTVTQTTTPPLLISGVATSPDGKSVSFFVSGGADNTTYEVEVLATTTAGQTKNDQIFYLVKQV